MFLKKKSLTKKAMGKKCTFQNQTNRLQCTALMLLSRWVIGSNPNGVPNFVNGPHSGFCRYRCSGWRSPEGNNSNGKNKICNEEQESDGEVRRAQAA